MVTPPPQSPWRIISSTFILSFSWDVSTTAARWELSSSRSPSPLSVCRVPLPHECFLSGLSLVKAWLMEACASGRFLPSMQSSARVARVFPTMKKTKDWPVDWARASTPSEFWVNRLSVLLLSHGSVSSGVYRKHTPPAGGIDGD